MTTIEVVASIISNGDKILATQRGYGEWQGWWEFPGGKIEPLETKENALIREIREELSADIKIDKLICTVDYDYPSFHLTMHCYLCTLINDKLSLNEHNAICWLSKEELYNLNWLPADLQILPILKDII